MFLPQGSTAPLYGLPPHLDQVVAAVSSASVKTTFKPPAVLADFVVSMHRLTWQDQGELVLAILRRSVALPQTDTPATASPRHDGQPQQTPTSGGGVLKWLAARGGLLESSDAGDKEAKGDDQFGGGAAICVSSGGAWFDVHAAGQPWSVRISA